MVKCQIAGGEKVPSALKPSTSEDKKLRSIHLATVQMRANKHMHSPADSETDGQEHLSIYDGGIM